MYVSISIFGVYTLQDSKVTWSLNGASLKCYLQIVCNCGRLTGKPRSQTVFSLSNCSSLRGNRRRRGGAIPVEYSIISPAAIGCCKHFITVHVLPRQHEVSGTGLRSVPFRSVPGLALQSVQSVPAVHSLGHLQLNIVVGQRKVQKYFLLLSLCFVFLCCFWSSWSVN